MKTRDQMAKLLRGLSADWATVPKSSRNGQSNSEDLDKIGEWIDDLTITLQSGEVTVSDKSGELFKWIKDESDILDIYLED